jgi:hypothetical protein
MLTKFQAYRRGLYKFRPAPVCIAHWDERSWINHIDACRGWTCEVATLTEEQSAIATKAYNIIFASAVHADDSYRRWLYRDVTLFNTAVIDIVEQGALANHSPMDIMDAITAVRKTYDDLTLLPLSSPMPVSGWNPRYVAYATAQGRKAGEDKREPFTQAALDRLEYPGGCMTGFILWIDAAWQAFAAIHNEKSARDLQANQAHSQRLFDEWLPTYAPQEAPDAN